MAAAVTYGKQYPEAGCPNSVIPIWVTPILGQNKAVAFGYYSGHGRHTTVTSERALVSVGNGRHTRPL
jgi:hypothetical protein